MRPLKVYFLPDMWNNWNWFIYDYRDIPVALSNQSHFHLIDAQREAEWPAAGLVDTGIRCFHQPESINAEKEVRPRVQA
jgi:hypothetical protein